MGLTATQKRVFDEISTSLDGVETPPVRLDISIRGGTPVEELESLRTPDGFEEAGGELSSSTRNSFPEITFNEGARRSNTQVTKEEFASIIPRVLDWYPTGSGDVEPVLSPGTLFLKAPNGKLVRDAVLHEIDKAGLGYVPDSAQLNHLGNSMALPFSKERIQELRGVRPENIAIYNALEMILDRMTPELAQNFVDASKELISALFDFRPTHVVDENYLHLREGVSERGCFTRELRQGDHLVACCHHPFTSELTLVELQVRGFEEPGNALAELLVNGIGVTSHWLRIGGDLEPALFFRSKNRRERAIAPESPGRPNYYQFGDPSFLMRIAPRSCA